MNSVAGEEEYCYCTIRDFYTLRSNVVHGNTTLKADAKTRATIQNIELIIMRILLRVLEFNKTFSYKQISMALTRSLYLPQSFDEILNSQNKV